MDAGILSASLYLVKDIPAQQAAFQLIPGTHVQTWNGNLDAIAGLNSAANKIPYFTASTSASLADFTAAGRTLVGANDAAAQRTSLGLVPGTNIQAWNSNLDALSVISPSANTIAYFTSTGAMTLTPVTQFSMNLLSANDFSGYPFTSGASSNNSKYDLVFNSVSANSAYWNSAFTTLTANSANWNNASTSIRVNSGIWNTAYTSLTANSATWNNAGNSIRASSGVWNSAYTSLTANSANWNNASSSISSNSASWNNVSNAASIIALTGLTLSANQFPYYSSTTSASLTPLSNSSRTFLSAEGFHDQCYLLGAKPYNGFENRTSSTIQMSNSSFVITPVGSYNFWMDGIKFTKSTQLSAIISADLALSYVFFDSSGTLSASTSIWNITDSAVPVATVYKSGSGYALGEERHGYARNRDWHKWAHQTIGARYYSGYTCSFSNTALTASQGVVYDEDIINDSLTTRNNCSLWYRTLALSSMYFESGVTTPYKAIAGVLQYDSNGSLSGVTNNSYVCNYVYGTSDVNYPVYVIVGQAQYGNVTNARLDSLPIIPLSTAEWKLLYRVIYRNVGGTATYIESADYRNVSSGPAGTSVLNDHNSLINRDALNAHPFSALQGNLAMSQMPISGDWTVSGLLINGNSLNTGHVIQSASGSLIQRNYLNFTGFTIQDNPGANSTEITLPTTTYKAAFTSASLVGGVLTVNHGLNDQYALPVTISDNVNDIIIPGNINYTDANNLSVTIGREVSGTWQIRVLKQGGGVAATSIPVVVDSTSARTMTYADFGKLIIFTLSGGSTYNLASASGINGWYPPLNIKCETSGGLTVSAYLSQNIDGDTYISMSRGQSLKIVSDGSNYRSF